MMQWQWHQWDHTQIICTSLQTDNHVSNSSLDLFTGRMLFLMPNQQCQSTEGKYSIYYGEAEKMAIGTISEEMPSTS